MAANALLMGDQAEVQIWEESGKRNPGAAPYNVIGKISVDGKKLPLAFVTQKQLMASRGTDETGLVAQGQAPDMVACQYCDGVADHTLHTGLTEGYKCRSCNWMTMLSPTQLEDWKVENIVRTDGRRIRRHHKGTAILATFDVEGEGLQVVVGSTSNSSYRIGVYRNDEEDPAKAKQVQAPIAYTGRVPTSEEEIYGLTMTFLEDKSKVEVHDPKLQDTEPITMFPEVPQFTGPAEVLQWMDKVNVSRSTIYLKEHQPLSMTWRPDVRDGAIRSSRGAVVPIDEIAAVKVVLPAFYYGEGRVEEVFCVDGYEIPDDQAAKELPEYSDKKPAAPEGPATVPVGDFLGAIDELADKMEASGETDIAEFLAQTAVDIREENMDVDTYNSIMESHENGTLEQDMIRWAQESVYAESEPEPEPEPAPEKKSRKKAAA
jgi:hypothetical protein